jgi:hypothetical protein
MVSDWDAVVTVRGSFFKRSFILKGRPKGIWRHIRGDGRAF